MDTGRSRGVNYNTIGSPKTSNSKLVLCVHGNRFGMTRCCDDFVDQNKPPDASSVTMTGNVEELGGSTDGQRQRGSLGGNFWWYFKLALPSLNSTTSTTQSAAGEEEEMK